MSSIPESPAIVIRGEARPAVAGGSDTDYRAIYTSLNKIVKERIDSLRSGCVKPTTSCIGTAQKITSLVSKTLISVPIIIGAVSVGLVLTTLMGGATLLNAGVYYNAFGLSSSAKKAQYIKVKKEILEIMKQEPHATFEQIADETISKVKTMNLTPAQEREIREEVQNRREREVGGDSSSEDEGDSVHSETHSSLGSPEEPDLREWESESDSSSVDEGEQEQDSDIDSRLSNISFGEGDEAMIAELRKRIREEEEREKSDTSSEFSLGSIEGDRLDEKDDVSSSSFGGSEPSMGGCRLSQQSETEANSLGFPRGGSYSDLDSLPDPVEQPLPEAVELPPPDRKLFHWVM